ncbi:MAG TPA: phosphotransferase [Candidatus Baltobacteraceae bacterium]|nr:phosphotransferase [Candidatus Baltobacteraceae bacterium]
MTEPWTADLVVTPELVRRSIARQFPDLALESIELLGEGWDNAAFLVDDAYVFRFPRRAVSAPLIQAEIDFLPRLARQLPLPISAPRFAGKPSAEFPWPFAGYTLLRATPLSAAHPDSAAIERIAVALGEFLRALHAIDASGFVADGLVGDEIGRLDHAQRMPKLRARFEVLSSAGLLADPTPLLDYLEAIAPTGPRQDRCVVVHGDLYARHVLVDDGGCVEGIIDWGDVHYGDPAVDVSILFEVLPPSARAAFADAYGSVDDRTLELARYRAIYHAALVAYYGHRIGDAELLAAGLAGLAYARPD